MRNALNQKNLNERPAARAILALTLTASLAAFGCTTNKTPGNGDPVHLDPQVGPASAPTSGVTSGSSSGTPVPTPPPPPMMSSSTYIEALPTVTTRAKRLPLSPDEAAAVMAGHQSFSPGVKVLGPVNPGPSTQLSAVANGPSTIGPAATNTINNSINSAGRVVGAVSSGPLSATDVSGVVNNATIAGTTGVASTAGSTVATPTNAAVPVSPGTFAAGPSVATSGTPGVVTNAGAGNTTTLTPTANAAAVPTPTVTSGTTVINPGTAPTVSRSTTTSTTAAASTATPATGSTTATVANPARTVISNESGKVTASKSQK